MLSFFKRLTYCANYTFITILPIWT